MLVNQTEIRNRMEELKLSYGGYNRQLGRPDLTGDRRERLEAETALLAEELAALEKLAQLGRMEPDRGKVEAAVRERLDALGMGGNVSGNIDAAPVGARHTSPLPAPAEADRDLSSGEARALLWALGEDRLTRNARFLTEGREQSDPTRTDKMLPNILIHTLESGPSPEARASAAYELGKLRIEQAIHALAAALNDEPLVAEIALVALRTFSEEQLREAGVEDVKRET